MDFPPYIDVDAFANDADIGNDTDIGNNADIDVDDVAVTDSMPMLVRFQDCRPNFDAKYCEKCKRFLKNSSYSCPLCDEDYGRCSPYWDIYFTIDSDNYQVYIDPDDNDEKIAKKCVNKYKRDNRRLNVYARGEVLDPILGFSAKDFSYLCWKTPEIDWDDLIQKFFSYKKKVPNSSIGVRKSYDFIITLDTHEKIKQFCLKPGSSITFRQWITSGPDNVKIDEETITSFLLEKYLDDEDDDESAFGVVNKL